MAVLAPIAASVAAGAATAGAAAVSAISAIGFAQGMMLVGTGLGLVGQITGNKTLSKIGLGFSVAGGVSGLASAATSQAGKQAVSGSTTATTKLLETDNIDEALAGKTPGAKTMKDLQTFEPGDAAMAQSMDAFGAGSGKIGQGVGGSSASGSAVNPEQERSFWQRAGSTLQRYDTTANVLMGMGNAYMQTRGIQANEDMLDKRIGFDQKQIDRQVANYGAPTTGYATPGVRRVPGIVDPSGLLKVR